jgi:hypothetical protein
MATPCHTPMMNQTLGNQNEGKHKTVKNLNFIFVIYNVKFSSHGCYINLRTLPNLTILSYKGILQSIVFQNYFFTIVLPGSSNQTATHNHLGGYLRGDVITRLQSARFWFRNAKEFQGPKGDEN